MLHTTSATSDRQADDRQLHWHAFSGRCWCALKQILHPTVQGKEAFIALFYDADLIHPGKHDIAHLEDCKSPALNEADLSSAGTHVMQPNGSEERI